MRNKILLILLAGLWAGAFTQIVSADTLHIDVENVNDASGHVMVQVLKGKAQFDGDEAPIAAMMLPASGAVISFTAEDLPAGEYAFRVMHDVNDNGKLDSNFIGIPTEPWAFSNNATGNFGPPSWEDSRFELSGSETQKIKLVK